MTSTDITQGKKKKKRKDNNCLNFADKTADKLYAVCQFSSIACKISGSGGGVGGSGDKEGQGAEALKVLHCNIG